MSTTFTRHSENRNANQLPRKDIGNRNINLYDITLHDLLLNLQNKTIEKVTVLDNTISTTDVQTQVTLSKVYKKEENEQLLIQAVIYSIASTPSKKTLSFEIRNVLSNKIKRVGNIHETFYKVRSYDTTATISLVDEGTNGDIAGTEVRVIEKFFHQVDVQRIDNH